jgi:hypothetical protein
MKKKGNYFRGLLLLLLSGEMVSLGVGGVRGTQEV